MYKKTDETAVWGVIRKYLPLGGSIPLPILHARHAPGLKEVVLFQTVKFRLSLVTEMRSDSGINVEGKIHCGKGLF